MKAKERRQVISKLLLMASEPISASKLAEQVGVSRQIIVGDVALLRANGWDILSTPKGYILSPAVTVSGFTGKIVCHHSLEETKRELDIIVANGGQILDVEVEHPLYGLLTAQLQIKNQDDANRFWQRLSQSKAELLSSLTEGIHLHTIACQDSDTFEQIKKSLAAEGFLLV
ncbi:3H domain-containing protein [Streptococcus dentiloxodontae]